MWVPHPLHASKSTSKALPQPLSLIELGPSFTTLYKGLNAFTSCTWGGKRPYMYYIGSLPEYMLLSFATKDNVFAAFRGTWNTYLILSRLGIMINIADNVAKPTLHKYIFFISQVRKMYSHRSLGRKDIHRYKYMHVYRQTDSHTYTTDRRRARHIYCWKIDQYWHDF